MKKLWFIIALAITLVFTSCSYTSTNDSTDVGIPEHVSHIEFYNGGLMIGSYENATVKITIKSRDKVFKVNDSDAKTSWIIYRITSNGKTENIIDSESLCIKYY